MQKVKAEADKRTLIIRHQTIHERKFEIQCELGKFGAMQINTINFNCCSISKFPDADYLFKSFPNLITLKLHNAKLDNICSFYLKGFDKLGYLFLDYNHIEELPSDLFKHTPNLQQISFASNKIKFIGEGILEPLKNLKSFDLRYNPSINVRYHYQSKPGDNSATLIAFQDAIKRCKPLKDVWKVVDEQKKELSHLKNKLQGQEKEFAVLKKTCEALERKLEVYQVEACPVLDFNVKVKGKKFKIQKKFLAANSQLFANLIRDNEDVDTLTFEDISEEAFEEVLKFMVNKSPPKPTANFIELYAVSGRLQMKGLMEVCARALMDKVTPENSLEFLVLCKKYPNIALEKKALEELKKNYEN